MRRLVYLCVVGLIGTTGECGRGHIQGEGVLTVGSHDGKKITAGTDC